MVTNISDNLYYEIDLWCNREVYGRANAAEKRYPYDRNILDFLYRL